MFMADGDVLAMTDWDMAHLGDPGEDWSYSLSMRDMPPASRQLWIGLFEREAGVRMSTDKWTYWEAFNAYKMAVHQSIMPGAVPVRPGFVTCHGDRGYRSSTTPCFVVCCRSWSEQRLESGAPLRGVRRQTLPRSGPTVHLAARVANLGYVP